jgi:acyl-CoA reductase-like NAD-dependent aldehyde dehydrogenase
MRTFAGCSKREIDSQAQDPESDFSAWAEKNRVKRNEIRKRGADRIMEGEMPDAAAWDEDTQLTPDASKTASESR